MTVTGSRDVSWFINYAPRNVRPIVRAMADEIMAYYKKHQAKLDEIFNDKTTGVIALKKDNGAWRICSWDKELKDFNDDEIILAQAILDCTLTLRIKFARCGSRKSAVVDVYYSNCIYPRKWKQSDLEIFWIVLLAWVFITGTDFTNSLAKRFAASLAGRYDESAMTYFNRDESRIDLYKDEMPSIETFQSIADMFPGPIGEYIITTAKDMIACYAGTRNDARCFRGVDTLSIVFKETPDGLVLYGMRYPGCSLNWSLRIASKFMMGLLQHLSDLYGGNYHGALVCVNDSPLKVVTLSPNSSVITHSFSIPPGSGFKHRPYPVELLVRAITIFMFYFGCFDDAIKAFKLIAKSVEEGRSQCRSLQRT